MEILVTGASGFVGSALIPRLCADGHAVRAFARDPERVRLPADVPVHIGDVVTGEGLEAALDGCEAAYFLVHSMEPGDASFADRDRRAAREFALAARRAGVRRVIYLGGLVPAEGHASPHLASRLEVEEILLDSSPEAVALRASIVIAARSRSFRFLVRIVERLPVLALPGWRDNRTRPIDGRDVLEFLARAAVVPEAAGRSLDIAGPDVLAYGEMVERIRDLMLLPRPSVTLERNATGIASRVGAVIAGEEHALVGPLMAGLTQDLLPRDDMAPELLGVRLHSFDAAVERALREWEEREPLAAR
ncbi:MAG: hypothetical protein QOE65_2832 [Solirubrobacteraceae bacterium]|jgi:uncharacterized protein YbjT (DUF2867 family)|nr:hypothetical protein [Solirubrobacteraceae bacterium]